MDKVALMSQWSQGIIHREKGRGKEEEEDGCCYGQIYRKNRSCLKGHKYYNLPKYLV